MPSLPPQMPVRIALAVAAVSVAVAILALQGEEDRCDEAGAQILRETTGTAPRSTLAPSVRTLTGGCRDSSALLAGAGALISAGRAAEALPLARRAVREEPENFQAWRVLSAALGEKDPRGAAEARRRAKELNALEAG